MEDKDKPTGTFGGTLGSHQKQTQAPGSQSEGQLQAGPSGSRPRQPEPHGEIGGELSGR